MTERTETSWKTYEEVAQYLLHDIASEFGLGSVEGKQLVPGESGTHWEIDAKGLRLNDDGFVLIECRRYTTARLSQEDAAAIAYRIKDTGATSGIIVSPMDLQKGAQKVAQHENMAHVRLSPTSTTTEYVLQFLNKTFVGLSEKLPPMTDSVTAVVTRAACNAGHHDECPGDCACACHGGAKSNAGVDATSGKCE